MIFIWGRYKSVKRYGHVADWCPQCASVQALVVTSLGTRPHVYFIPLIPRRELTGILAECACGASWNVDPARYTRMLKEPTTDLAALSAATHPGIAVEAQRQLTLEDRTAAKQLTSEDRVDLMLRAVTSASPAYIVERMNMRFDWPSGLGCLGAIALAREGLPRPAGAAPGAVFPQPVCLPVLARVPQQAALPAQRRTEAGRARPRTGRHARGRRRGHLPLEAHARADRQGLSPGSAFGHNGSERDCADVITRVPIGSAP